MAITITAERLIGPFTSRLVLSAAVAALGLGAVAALQFFALSNVREANQDVHAVARLEQLSGEMARRITLIRASLFPEYEGARGAAEYAALLKGLDDADDAVGAFVAFADSSVISLEGVRSGRTSSARAFLAASRERLDYLSAAPAGQAYPEEQRYLALRQQNLDDEDAFQHASSALLGVRGGEDASATSLLGNTIFASAGVLLALFVAYVWGDMALISRRRLAEERRANSEAVSAHRAEMVSMASHELRNPLATVVLSSELIELLARDIGDEDLVEAAVDSQVAAFRADGIVGELLDLGRIDAGRLDLAIRPTNIAPIIREAVKNAGRYRGEHDVAVLGEPDAVVSADPDRLWIIINNIVDNAFKYSPQGSPVEVSVGRENGETVVSVTDSGPGIAEGDEELVFSRFHRLKATAHVGGIGIGLHISREIARRMGGELAVIPGSGGARLVLRLPSAVENV